VNKETKYTIEVIYLGERPDLFGQIKQIFRDRKGRIYSYKGVRGVYFGCSYLVSKDGMIETRPKEFDKQKLTLTEQDHLDFSANVEICKHIRAKQKKALEVKKPHPNLVNALDLLRPFTRNMDNLELTRFTDYIKNQLSKKRKK
jgi:hypothetical protein